MCVLEGYDQIAPAHCYLQVQRNWMYLENIFIGSEDIRKQLPQESVMFDQVHATFMKQMQQLNTAHNVVQVSPVSTNAGTECLLSVSKGL